MRENKNFVKYQTQFKSKIFPGVKQKNANRVRMFYGYFSRHWLRSFGTHARGFTPKSQPDAPGDIQVKDNLISQSG